MSTCFQQHPLLLTVKTEHRFGSAANNPYLAFRRKTEKMQTRKNRKNDETSYEKMLKLRRDLSRAVTLFEMVKRREKTKREHLHLTIEVYEKRCGNNLPNLLYFPLEKLDFEFYIIKKTVQISSTRL